MCTQTGLNPNRRTIVASFALVVALKNTQPIGQFWIDVSNCGLEETDAKLAAMDTEEGAVRYAVSQWHYYYQDGGHMRNYIRHDMQSGENSCNHYYPELGQKVLSPRPEYWIQENITENPYYVAP